MKNVIYLSILDSTSKINILIVHDMKVGDKNPTE